MASAGSYAECLDDEKRGLFCVYELVFKPSVADDYFSRLSREIEYESPLLYGKWPIPRQQVLFCLKITNEI